MQNGFAAIRANLWRLMNAEAQLLCVEDGKFCDSIVPYLSLVTRWWDGPHLNFSGADNCQSFRSQRPGALPPTPHTLMSPYTIVFTKMFVCIIINHKRVGSESKLS